MPMIPAKGLWTRFVECSYNPNFHYAPVIMKSNTTGKYVWKTLPLQIQVKNLLLSTDSKLSQHQLKSMENGSSDFMEQIRRFSTIQS